MNDLREKIKLAIRANHHTSATCIADAVLAVLREQEPVGVVGNACYATPGIKWNLDLPLSGTKLYAAPVPPTEPAVPEGFVWPLPPPRRGQSPVLFDDGYEEGWAKCISTIQAMLAAAAAAAAAPKPKGGE